MFLQARGSNMRKIPTLRPMVMISLSPAVVCIDKTKMADKIRTLLWSYKAADGVESHERAETKIRTNPAGCIWFWFVLSGVDPRVVHIHDVMDTKCKSA